MKPDRTVLLIALVVLIAAVFYFDLLQYFTLENWQRQRSNIQGFYSEQTALTVLLYMLVYIVYTGLSLPGAGALSLIAGALFGLWLGVIIVSVASTAGACLAFLLSRYLFKDYVQTKFGKSLERLNAGIEKDGAFYLFAMRLVPAVPFFVINLVMALTPIRLVTFWWVSQVGMLAGTVVYINAGTQLGQLTSIGDLLSPVLIGSFVLLGVFPLIAKKVIELTRARMK